MADHEVRESTATTVHDGRFGEHFDDEISSRSVVQGLIGIGGVTAVFIVLMVFLWNYFLDDLAAKAVQVPTLVEEGVLLEPPGPRLQADPEGELLEMRREMAERLGGYGWVDEAGGTVHIPIDDAIDALLERGVAPLVAMPAPVDEATPTADPASETPSEESAEGVAQ